MTTIPYDIQARMTIDGDDPAIPVTVHVTIEITREYDGFVARIPEIPETFTIAHTCEAAWREVVAHARRAITGEAATIDATP